MRKKLLLADDSITIQKVVELTFPSDEFEVVTAGNGRLAVDKATTFLPDVVLCDVIMPQLDGYQVCEALRAIPQLQDVPILLLNGAFEPYDPERARAVGALGNVSKPFDPPALVLRVKDILAERAAAADVLAEAATVPLSLDEPEPVQQPEDANTADLGVPEPAAQEYDYEESETAPVSTVEVPLGIREMAARSMALDAPVFAPAEPDVLTEEADLSETLHGPVDSPEIQPFEEPGVDTQALEPQPEPEPQPLEAQPMEELAPEEPAIAEAAAELELPSVPESAERTEELQAMPATGEFEPNEAIGAEGALPEVETPEPVAAEVVPEGADDLGEPRDFEASQEPDADLLPKTLPPMMSPFGASASASAQPAQTAPGFEPEGIQAQTESEVAPEAEASLEIGAPEEALAAPAAMPAEAPSPEPAELPEHEMAPNQLDEPEPVAPAAATDTAAGAFDGLVPPEETAAPVRMSVGATVASAEVAVPVDMVQQIAQRVISQVSERIIREIAWDVLPGLAEKLVKAEIDRIKARAESERD
jgi:CheY-like chemotaxis protein